MIVTRKTQFRLGIVGSKYYMDVFASSTRNVMQVLKNMSWKPSSLDLIYNTDHVHINDYINEEIDLIDLNKREIEERSLNSSGRYILGLFMLEKHFNFYEHYKYDDNFEPMFFTVHNICICVSFVTSEIIAEEGMIEDEANY